MSEWRKLHGAGQKKGESVETTTRPARLATVVSSLGREPWGTGFKGGLVNMETKKALKAIRSPEDNYTYVHQWYDRKKLWAHIKLDGDKGYCTLEQFLDVPETKELWNDQSLVASWTFHKDSIEGPEIDEAEAIELSKLFPADAATPQAGSRRRTFEETEPAGGSSSTGAARKRTRCFGPDMLIPASTLPAFDPSLTFAVVCNTAEWPDKLQPGNKGLRRSWIVRYKCLLLKGDFKDVQCLLCCDQYHGYQPPPKFQFHAVSRRIFMPASREHWVRCPSPDYANQFAAMLGSSKLVKQVFCVDYSGELHQL